MRPRKPLGMRELRQMRLAFTLMACFFFAFAAWVLWEQRIALNVRRPSRVIVLEGAEAARMAAGHALLGVAMLFPWLGGRPARAAAFFGVFLACAVVTWVFPLQRLFY